MTGNDGTPDQYRTAVAVWADAYATNRRRLQESRDELRDAVQQAVAAGVTEVEAARLSGVTRMTVRKWVGK